MIWFLKRIPKDKSLAGYRCGGVMGGMEMPGVQEAQL